MSNCDKNIEFKYCFNEAGDNISSVEITVTNEKLKDVAAEFKGNYDGVTFEDEKAKVKVEIKGDIATYDLPDEEVTKIYDLLQYGAGVGVESTSETMGSSTTAAAVNERPDTENYDDEVFEAYEEQSQSKQPEKVGASEYKPGLDASISLKPHNGGGKSSSLRKSRRKRRNSRTLSKRDYIII